MGTFRLAVGKREKVDGKCCVRIPLLSDSFGRFGCASNGTARTWSNAHNFRQARAAHRLDGHSFISAEPQNANLPTVFSNLTELVLRAVDPARWNARRYQAPGCSKGRPPRRARGGVFWKREIRRVGYHHRNGNTSEEIASIVSSISDLVN